MTFKIIATTTLDISSFFQNHSKREIIQKSHSHAECEMYRVTSISSRRTSEANDAPFSGKNLHICKQKSHQVKTSKF